MFIPYGSDQVFYKRPWVTYSIIATNVIVFLYEKTLGLRGLHAFLQNFAFIPSEFSPVTLVTSLFIHSGILHLVGNMWFFALVAPVVEDRLGPAKFLIMYLGGGVVGNLAQAQFIPEGMPDVRILGSSGCVFSIIGAYTILFPYSNIKVAYFFLVFLRFYSGTLNVPAIILWGLYFVMNLYNLYIVPAHSIAYGAHSAGFVVGAVIAAIFYGLRQFLGKKEDSKKTSRPLSEKKIPFASDKQSQPDLAIAQAREQLQRLVFMGDVSAVEKTYSEILARFPEFVLQPGPQYDLGRFLAKHNKLALALHTFERLIATAPEVPVAQQALLEAGKLCRLIPGKLEQGLYYLQLFIRGDISPQQYQEAAQLIQLMERELLQTKPDNSLQSRVSAIVDEVIDSSTLQDNHTPDKAQDKRVRELLEISKIETPAYKSLGPEYESQEDKNSHPMKMKTFAPVTEEQTISQTIKPTADKAGTDSLSINLTELDEIDLELGKLEELKEPEKLSLSKDLSPSVSPSPETTPAEFQPARETKWWQELDNLSSSEVSESPSDKINWQSGEYFLIIPRKENINFRLLAQTIADYRQIDLTTAERLLVIGKGIILRQVPFADALRLCRELTSKGQRIIAVLSEPETLLPSPIDIRCCWFYKDYIELATEQPLAMAVEKRRYLWKDIKFLSCGNVDMEPGQSAFKALLDFVVATSNEPLRLFRIWENTFEFKSTNLSLNSMAQENFLLLVTEIYNRSRNAVTTPVVREMVRQRALAPRQFAAPDVYENYTLWYYLNYFGRRLPIVETQL